MARRITLWTVLVLLLGVTAALGLNRVRGPRVHVVRAARNDVVQTVVANGRIRAPSRAEIGSTLVAVVREVRAREGERVIAGALLVQLDDTELQAQLAQSRAALTQANARLTQIRTVGSRVALEQVRQMTATATHAESELRRAETLFAAGAMSPTQMDEARRAFETARAQRASAEIQANGASLHGSEGALANAQRAQALAAMQVAEARLAETRIVAPADGVIAVRSVEPGNLAQPGRTLLSLIPDGPVEITIEPNEVTLASLRVGQSAIASSEAFPADRFHATLSYIAPAVDPARGTIEVRLRIADAPPYLRPEMTVSVEIEVGRRSNVTTLPADAVRDLGTSHPWVLVVRDGAVERRDVTLGLRGARFVEIDRGVAPGDAVLPPSETRVHAGQRVRVEGG